MNTRTVGSVMTGNVVTARPDTSFKDLVATLTDERVSALPVVDDEGRVVGIVSEGDLLHRLDLPPDSPHHRLLRRHRSAPAGPLGDIAAGLMTRPVVTIGSDATVGHAARLLEKHGVKRLPVVDGGRLVGIVSRRDLLSTYLRADDDIRAEVRGDVLRRVLLTDPDAVEMAVDGGVVTLTGTVDRRSTAEIAGRLARAVSGVVDVVNLLDWQYDDSTELKRHYVFNARVGPTVRWPD